MFGQKLNSFNFFSCFFSRYSLFLPVVLMQNLYAQVSDFDFTKPPEKGTRHRAEVMEGDTIPVVDLSTVYVYGTYEYKTHKQYEQWTRIKYNVKKVYPYAIIASAKLKEYDRALMKIENEHLKKLFIKACEKDLREQFENDLRSLTISQGKMLMKLIDRETGKTTYEVVKQMRGNFQANMWQAVARVFGHNMKVEYDAVNEDILIERAIKVVESGIF